MQAHNKALKRDSCRVAFLVCGDFCGENGLRKAGLCGTHPLTRRYVYLYFSGLKLLRSMFFAPFGSSSELPQQIRIVGPNS
ncbi:DUF3265 domain-containing protein [Vibrio parahaemolyticus]|nr:DUF3265 domain-containing protein [Vibrio parahaemolyticus]EGR1762938.1 DUF3265 domain-containing protein [Vibrio parahaemolyticus]